jgi:leader peptidase (prepilin peptidase)/N-methyltransferase
MTTVLAAVLGLFVGSFLNVVIYRVPRGESVVRPRSRCPGCSTQLAEYDNIPVVSWVLLRGKCRTCEERISSRYPIVELITAAVFGLLAYQVGLSWVLPAYLYLGAIGVALAGIDLDTMKLPDSIVLPAYPVTALLLGLGALGEHAWSAYLRAALGGLALYAFYLALRVVHPRGMGPGDVKLAGVLGAYLAWFGWGTLVVGGFAGFLLGGLGGIVLMAFKGAGLKTRVPYGPYMLVGTLLGILAGETVSSWYLHVLGR